jgi:hypothetical protein
MNFIGHLRNFLYIIMLFRLLRLVDNRYSMFLPSPTEAKVLVHAFVNFLEISFLFIFTFFFGLSLIHRHMPNTFF